MLQHKYLEFPSGIFFYRLSTSHNLLQYVLDIVYVLRARLRLC